MKVLVLTLSTLLWSFHHLDALECYKCSAFGKDDPSECGSVDDKTKTIKCESNEAYCIAIGHKYYNYQDNKTTYTNLRRCDNTNSTCLRAYYAYGDNLRNCQTCITDKCNIAPLGKIIPST